ncbi:unnamed protein product [Blepharisma stoltei]|uniref:Receptor ligand binding region domain-containing protein n=1 Tax=Blepharisma stoltei TaxID=1481888 RepID=A0AAU9I8N1_9CILI|nr:unnamed protein product [Blepharisma stoltei]
MNYIWYFIFASFAYCQIKIEIFYSSDTDPILASTVFDSVQQNYNNQVEAKLVNLSLNPIWLTSGEIFHMAIDLTFTISLSNLIKQYASQNEIIMISSQDSPSFSSWEFFIHPSEQDQTNALSALISYLNWEKIIVLADSDWAKFKKLPSANIKSFFFPSNGDQKSAEIVLKKEIKPAGIKNIVILNKGEVANFLVKSIKDANLFSLGTGIILGTKSWYNATETGLFGIVELGLENVTDSYSYEALGVEKIINIVLNCRQCSDIHDIRSYLEKNTINHRPISNFTVLNVKNSEKTKVGYIYDQQLVISKALVFIGNSSVIPNSPYTNITISISDGITNPGYSNSSYSDKMKEGAKYALMYAKNNNFIDGFAILVTHTDCGAEVYYPKFSLNCFTKLKNSLGVGLLTTPYLPTVIGNINSLRALNISIPQISEIATSPILMNKTTYPEFMRMTKDNRYNFAGFLNLFAIFQWKKFIIVYDQTPSQIVSYQFLLSSINQTGFEIVNPPDKREIKQNYGHSDYSTYKPWMEEFLKSKVRIFLLLMIPPAQLYFVEDLYNAGFRKGDIILFVYSRSTSAFAYEPDPAQMKKLEELYYGTITMDQAEWVGEYGKKIQKGYEKAFSASNDAYRCFSFDTAMLLLNGIKYTIDQGGSVEDFATLNANLRMQRFIGCSGTVSIDKDSNDRSTAVIGIYNIRWNENSLYNYQIGTYDLSSQQLFTFTDNVIWYDNSSNIPSDLIAYSCDFDPKSVEFSMNGAKFLYIVDSCVLISVFIALFIIKQYWYHIMIKPLAASSEVAFWDYLAYLIIFIDFLQFLFLGPDFSAYDKYLNQLVKISMYRFDWGSSKDIYLVYFYISFALSFIVIFFSTRNLWSCWGRFKMSFCNIFEKLPEWLIPFVGNICYMPILFTLLGVFQCDQSIGNEITDSFMRQDCEIFCWKGHHITLVVLAVIALILYLPVAMNLKLYCDAINVHSNIQVWPTFLLEKRVFQTIVIALNNTLLVHYQSLYGLIYILLIICFIIFTKLKRKQYNYSRCNLWLMISYIAVIWNIGISSIYKLFDDGFLEKWAFLQYGGWFFLLIIAVSIQHYYCPSLLYSEDPPDIALFFRFSLGKSIKASQINQLNKERNSRSQFSISLK